MPQESTFGASPGYQQLVNGITKRNGTGRVVPITSCDTKRSSSAVSVTYSNDSIMQHQETVKNGIPSLRTQWMGPRKEDRPGQGKSRPVACPSIRGDIQSMDNNESQASEELCRMYDKATWRMYYRILSARRSRNFESLSSHLKTEPNSGEIPKGSDHDLANFARTESHEAIPELDDEGGIFALEMEI
mmetsp:Transcript_3122/g.4667  ORF Transcript_3122/g.4667 Transcript_3122/m.4667 type:complete len:188 (+) Transcript_3122:64-627(+)